MRITPGMMGVLAGLGLALAGLAPAEAAAPVTVGGEVHAQVCQDLIAPDARFEINRAYINVKAEVTPWLSVRVTPDFVRAATGGLDGFLKFAYLDLTPPLAGLPGSRLKFTLGQHGRAWVAGMDEALGVRYITKDAADSSGWMGSADLGFTACGDFLNRSGGKTGLLNVAAGVYNGVGFRKPQPAGENFWTSLYEARLSVSPLANHALMAGARPLLNALSLQGVYVQDFDLAKGQACKITGGAVVLGHRNLDLAVEGLVRFRRGAAGSLLPELLVAPRLLLKLADARKREAQILASYSATQDPNRTGAAETRVWHRTVAALIVRPASAVAAALTYEHEAGANWRAGAAGAVQTLKLNTQVKF